MGLENLNDDQLAKINEFKKLPPRRGRPGKEFGPLLKIAAFILRDAGLSIKEIADELKVNPETAKKIFKDKEIKLETADMDKVRETFATNIAEIVNKMLVVANTNEYVHNLASSRNPGLIEAISKMIEKLNLLTGKPSNVLEVRDTAKFVQDKLQELENLEKALEQSIVLPDSPKDN